MKNIRVILVLMMFLIFSINFEAYANENNLLAKSNNNIQGTKYETERIEQAKKVNLSEDNNTPKEVVDDLNSLYNIKYLKLKTNSNFEVALAYSNGDYTYLDSANSIEEAIKIAQNYNDKEKSNVIPAVINKDGLVVYATEAIGKIVKIINGKPVTDANGNEYFKYTTPVYRNSTLNHDLTYINHGFIDDVPIISDNGAGVKVQVNGLIGWIDKEDEANSEVNIISVPINQASNLSYFAKNSQESLQHYISSDVQTNNKGNIRTIGVAPTFMETGKKYYSYDCKYFYQNITDLLEDLQSNSHNKSVNKDNPYYNYYTYLPARTKTTYSVKEINEYLEKNTPSNSVLRNKGKTIVDAQNKYGVNANLIIGIAMNESAKGTSNNALKYNNIFGLGVDDNNPSNVKVFESVDACIEDFASNWMSKGYFNPKDWRHNGSSLGNKAIGVNVRYATDPYWGEKAADFVYQIDRYISGDDELIEYNKHQLGVYTSGGTVNDSSNNLLYGVVKDKYLDGRYNAQVGQSLVILNESNGKTEMYPDIQVNINTQNKPSIYDWNARGYVNSSIVTKINKRVEKDREFKDFTVNNVNSEATQLIGTGVYGATVKAYVNNKQIGTSVNIDTTEKFQINIPKQQAGTNIEIEISKEGYNTTKKDILVEESLEHLEKGINYQTHIQDYGWQNWMSNGETSGTSGQSKRLEGIKIVLNDVLTGASISYRTHIQEDGWQEWKYNGEMSGTNGQSKRLEAIEIKLENAPGYRVEYRVHVQEDGWQDWKSNGEMAGTSGESKRLEAIEIKIVKEKTPNVEYRTHVEEYSWQEWKSNGEIAGTSGESKRLEGIEIKLSDAPDGANIVYQTHIQEDGWQGWKSNGDMSGTSGQSKRLEGIRIKLENMPGYTIEYRVHVQEDGWQDWKRDGEMAGTSGESKRLEAIEVRIVKK